MLVHQDFQPVFLLKQYAAGKKALFEKVFKLHKRKQTNKLSVTIFNQKFMGKTLHFKEIRVWTLSALFGENSAVAGCRFSFWFGRTHFNSWPVLSYTVDLSATWEHCQSHFSLPFKNCFSPQR